MAEQNAERQCVFQAQIQENTECDYNISGEERTILNKIVEAEAGGEDTTGKILVANVVLNRVKAKDFPDTVEEVVFEKTGNTYQFSPIYDGRYYSVNVSDDTKAAVERALNGEDNSEGALYFAMRSAADSDNMAWFDRCLTHLFRYGCHDFYRD